jgi:hypothetical protein
MVKDQLLHQFENKLQEAEVLPVTGYAVADKLSYKINRKRSYCIPDGQCFLCATENCASSDLDIKSIIFIFYKYKNKIKCSRAC